MPPADNRYRDRGPQQTYPAQLVSQPNLATNTRISPRPTRFPGTSNIGMTRRPVIHRQASKDSFTKICMDRATAVRKALAGRPTAESSHMQQEPLVPRKRRWSSLGSGAGGRRRSRSNSRSRGCLHVRFSHGEEHHGNREPSSVDSGKWKQTGKGEYPSPSSPSSPRYHEHGRGIDSDNYNDNGERMHAHGPRISSTGPTGTTSGGGARASVPRRHRRSLDAAPVVNPRVARVAFAISQSMGGPEMPVGLDRRLEERYERSKQSRDHGRRRSSLWSWP